MRHGVQCAMLMIALVVLSCPASAQQVSPSVTGKVTDDQGVGLPGVSVRLKNGTAGASTDKNGAFTVKVPNLQGTLVFNHIGFKKHEEPLRGRTSITITLLEDASKLNEVVVIGYGSTSKKDLTGSVSQVQVEDLQKAPVLSFDQALAGRVAGVQVSSNDGQPGAEGINIVIRGANSLSQSNSPLFVVDGFPMEDPENMSLNPEDIKTINILKDASATAIYGARGANGVVVIETKRGQIGAPVITATASLGFQEVSKRMDVMSPYEFVSYQLERDSTNAKTSYLSNATLDDYKNVKGVDWQDELFRNAPMQVYNLAMRGGNQGTKYSVSGSVADQQGVLVNSGLSRYQGRFVIDQNIGKKVTAGLNVNYSKVSNFGQIASSINAGNGASAYLLYSVWGYRPVSGKSLDDATDLSEELMDDEIDETMDYRINPIINAKNEVRRSATKNLLANAYIAYEIIPGLKLRISGGVENLSRQNTSFYNSLTSRGTPLFPNNTKGQYGSVNFVERSSWLNENTLTWTKRFNRKHRLEVLGGFTMQGNKASGYGFMSQNVPNESLGVAGLEQGIPGSTSSSATESKLGSFLARVNYNFLSRYLLTVSFRADGSSKFAPENRWAYFPSAAFAWQIKEEKFMQSLPFISDAKLRTSYGVTGNNRVNDFATLPALTSPIGASYSFNNSMPQTGVIQTSLGNTKLKWETTAQADLGLDLGFLKNRIQFTVDLYRKTTSDLLLNADLPATTAFARVYKNIGKVRNEGLELTLTTTNIKSGSFSWSTDVNVSFNRNKVLGLSENQDNLLSTVGWENSFSTVPLYVAALNQPAAMFFGYLTDGLYQVDDFDVSASGAYTLKLSEPTNGMANYRIQPGDIRYKDVNLDGVVDEKDRVVIGRVLPKHVGGLNNNFRYKGFDLGIFFQWSYGNKIYNANRTMFEGNMSNRTGLNQFASYTDRWSIDNQDSKRFRAGGYGPAGYYSDYFLEDGSYLRLKTVSLSYAIPSKILRSSFVKNISASVAAQNLYTWTKYSGMDPEVSVRNSALTPGFDYSAYPRARTLTFSIRAGF
ncbi:SusC/RagA family TonB-linked outer membrane protein [Chitinophaga sp. GCM10012297]|uniref:TonB-dependent receptor n=1 Tax=Chitinophaga chungangae TaxID=2821488 RepID=A0ABS3YA52_9BACT|nr:TonB-dependent receptor [Chitinophaga chungangae]MBO9151531.1 TonB-dependent receptor [Chitinophaga chungangae]